ncbi:MAG: M3 family oligoendopeptidase [Anaerolineae bacterium]|nr:M3 family oligoendopeptidase [Anaerolineae bacterium]
MTLPTLPTSIENIDPHRWDSFAPYFTALQEYPLTQQNVHEWLTYWSDLSRLVWETVTWVYIEKSLDTTDAEKEQTFLDLINHVVPPAQMADQALKERLLALEPADLGIPGMELVLRNLRNEADLYREENIPLQTEVSKLDNEYDKITGAMQANWDGEEKNLSQLAVFLKDKNRDTRQRAWDVMSALWLEQRENLNQIYVKMLQLRQQIAVNAWLPDYRAYAFRARGRFDYTPEDCAIFHNAIEAVAVPATRRILAKRRERLGYESIRPYDWIPERSLLVDTVDDAALHPYKNQDELIQGGLNMFNRLDVELGRYFATMAEEGLLDLDTRPGKALGGYCSTLPVRRRPFIFMNGTGMHDDVQTLLHEAGHAFHAFETVQLPLVWQMDAPMEFCEVASMAMELLAAPNLTQANGGFYTETDAARARLEHLENIITFLPYMAVVDTFQHWVYTHPEEALDPAHCDAAWDAQWQRFIPDMDWTGYEEVRRSGWHRKPHIFGSPFYYIEYGMASVGAMQVWRNGRRDHNAALAAYRHALSLGGTQTLPALFAAAGAEFRFDTPMLTELIGLVEQEIETLEAALA